MNNIPLFARQPILKSLTVFAVLVACLTGCSSSSDEQVTENSESQVEETDQSSATGSTEEETDQATKEDTSSEEESEENTPPPPASTDEETESDDTEEQEDPEPSEQNEEQPPTEQPPTEQPVVEEQPPALTEGQWLYNIATPTCDWRGTGSCGFYHRASDPDSPYVGRAGVEGDVNSAEWGSAGEWAYNINDNSCNFNGDGCGYFFTGTYDSYSIQALVSAPSAPSNLRAGPADGKAIVAWSGSSENGGIESVEYTVTASSGGATCVTTQTTCDITGLTNGTAYTFTVAATNGAFISEQSSSSSSITPGIPSSVLLNLDGGNFSDDAYISGGITVDWSANQGLGGDAGVYSYYNHAFAHYYDIGGGNGHGGVAWRDDRNVEIVDVTHDGTCVQLNEFKLQVENDVHRYGEGEGNTLELVSAVLYLYENGVVIGSQSTGLSLAQQVSSATTTVNVSAGEAGCVDQVRIVYNITGACDPDQGGGSPCWDEAEDSTLSVRTDDWVFNKWN